METVSKQVGNNKRASAKTTNKQALVSSINNTNNTNSTNKTNKLAQAKSEKNKIENKEKSIKWFLKEESILGTNCYVYVCVVDAYCYCVLLIIYMPYQISREVLLGFWIMVRLRVFI